MNLKKLDSLGATHIFFALLVVLLIGVGGTYLMVASHAATPTIMFDSADPRRIPHNAKVVASYVGNQQGYKIAKEKFPNAIVISINETPGSDDSADIWGIEPGAKTISQTISAIADGKAKGAYGTQSDLDAVRRGLTSKNIDRSSYVLWLSGAGTRTYKHIPEGDDAHQYKYVPNQYDVSKISPKFLSTLGKTAGATKKKSKTTKGQSTKNGYGKVTITSQELITDSSGNKSTKNRGNVQVKLISASSTASCRHLNVRYKPKPAGSKKYLIYTGKTDADKSHKSNLGKIHLNSCSSGVYRVVPVLSENYQVVKITSPIKVTKGHNTKVKIVISKKDPQASESDTGSDTSDQSQLEETAVDPSNPDAGSNNTDPNANIDPGQ